MSQKEPPANVKARWGTDTIWAILSNPWNHELSVPSTTSWPESATGELKLGRKRMMQQDQDHKHSSKRGVLLWTLVQLWWDVNELVNAACTPNIPRLAESCKEEWATIPMSRGEAGSWLQKMFVFSMAATGGAASFKLKGSAHVCSLCLHFQSSVLVK